MRRVPIEAKPDANDGRRCPFRFMPARIGSRLRHVHRRRASIQAGEYTLRSLTSIRGLSCEMRSQHRFVFSSFFFSFYDFNTRIVTHIYRGVYSDRRVSIRTGANGGPRKTSVVGTKRVLFHHRARQFLYSSCTRLGGDHRLAEERNDTKPTMGSPSSSAVYPRSTR